MTDRSHDRSRLTTHETSNGNAELVLTIENAIEDRVRTYTQLMRMKRVLATQQSSTEK